VPFAPVGPIANPTVAPHGDGAHVQLLNSASLRVHQEFIGCKNVAAFCRIRDYISAVKKNSRSVIEAIQGVFVENPFLPERTSMRRSISGG
jgi:hypothetical protein